MDNFNKNLLVAVNAIVEAKNKDKETRCRVETRVKSDSVKVYVIKHNKINEIITVSEDGSVVKKSVEVQ